jgi:putative transposase
MTFFRCIPWSSTFDEEVGGMKTLKQEEISGRSYRNLGQARSAIGAFIETAYNRQRLHSALAYRSPDEYEATLGRLPGVTSPPEVSITENCY